MKKTPPKITAGLLALLLFVPSHASALRPEGPGDNAPIQQKLRAGLEETQALREQLDRAINFSVRPLLRQMGLLKPEVGSAAIRRSYASFLVEVMAAFLDHPDPEAVRERVRALLSLIDREILAPIHGAKREWVKVDEDLKELRANAEVLPRAEDWFIVPLSPPLDVTPFEHRLGAVVVYSARASALVFGRNGPHLRKEFVQSDLIDVKTAPILLQGFLPELEQLLQQVRSLRAEGRSDPNLERQAREYAGALFNGLMIPDLKGASDSIAEYMGYYYRGWREQLQARSGLSLDKIVGLAADTFPEAFPSDPSKLPLFLGFFHEGFVTDEIPFLIAYNKSPPTALGKISLWDLTVGAESSTPYVGDSKFNYSLPVSGALNRAHLRTIYGILLQRGREALALFNNSKVVVVDAAWIEQEPRLEALLSRLDALPEYGRRVIILGSVPGKGWASFRAVATLGDFQTILPALLEEYPFLFVSFLGSEETALELRKMVLEYKQAGFAVPVPTPARALLALLNGLSIPLDLAQELATGLEELELLGRGA